MSVNDSLVPPLEAHRFDENALQEYLGPKLEGFSAGMRVMQFQGGQSNPTFLLEAGSKRYVLRKKPPGKLLPSAHMIEREYKVIAALNGTDVPVPTAHLLCEDADIIGTPFYVMDFVDGRVYAEPHLRSAPREERPAIFESMVDTLARLHNVDWQAVGLADFGKPENYVARQIKRWSQQYEASKTEEMPAMESLMRWLPDNIPDQDETGIAHGDFRHGNLMLHPERTEVVAVLDWELSTLGHPLADLAYFCLPYHLPASEKGAKGLVGLDFAAENIPSEEDVLAAYCKRSGRDGIPNWNFFLAFSLFRLAAILQGVYARALAGNASNADALQVGKRAGLLAQVGWDLAQRN
ncbi:phosphotransferase family protein [Alkalilimnicola ehrlichii]|uniref:Phosphotransferase family protein n=1 Tax=Alkalilimnicola ehrlichii TaxID=351052 RepID=A0A3E0WN28_9GAMM|nr:phosphotransferase [Alkalilimnicola ehrlichii]RFA27268.1 phosphotransferase family protein [Alkalilimnicola ehrlichii]RFA34380.1 phosphotransferase family protein [Alkalilimnicola ehrlichii]